MSQIRYYSPLAIYVFFLGMYVYQYMYPNKIIKLSLKYAIVYLSLIFIFGLIYFDCTPTLFLNSEGEYIHLYFDLGVIPHNYKILIMSMYYSVVTITTLGFGDISPNNLISMILTLIESILGIIFIGFFLNSLSHERSQKEEKEKEKIRKEEKEKYEERLIKEEKEREKTIILKYHSKLNTSSLQFNAVLFSIFYNDSPLYELSYEDQMKTSNVIKYNKDVFNNFEYTRFLNLNNQCATFKYLEKPQKDAIKNELKEITQLLNEMLFNYDFSYNKVLQVTIGKWLEVLDNDFYLNMFEYPVQNYEIEMLKKGINESEFNSNNIIYKYIILKMILEKSFLFYEKILTYIQELKINENNGTATVEHTEVKY